MRGAQKDRLLAVLLLVEDDEAERYVWRKTVAQLGYQIVAVDNAEIALMALETDRGITALITDIQLGDGMSGIDLARAAIAARPALKVLFITAYEMPKDVRLPAPVLMKPYAESALRQAVANLFGDAAAPAPH